MVLARPLDAAGLQAVIAGSGQRTYVGDHDGNEQHDDDEQPSLDPPANSVPGCDLSGGASGRLIGRLIGRFIGRGRCIWFTVCRKAALDHELYLLPAGAARVGTVVQVLLRIVARLHWCARIGR